MANNPNAKDNLVPFKKGDPRINTKGRPKSFDDVRKLARSIAHEVAKGKDGQPIQIDEHIVTVTEAILRQWARDSKMQEKFMEWTYGKLPAAVDITSDGKPLAIAIVQMKGDEL